MLFEHCTQTTSNSSSFNLSVIPNTEQRYLFREYIVYVLIRVVIKSAETINGSVQYIIITAGKKCYFQQIHFKKMNL